MAFRVTPLIEVLACSAITRLVEAQIRGDDGGHGQIQGFQAAIDFASDAELVSGNFDFGGEGGLGEVRAFDKPLRMLGYDRQSPPSNWKFYWENTRDPYHASEATKELNSYREDFKINDTESVQAKDEFGDGLYAQMQVFPSVHLRQHMNTQAMRHMVPRSPTECELVWTYFGYQNDDEELQRLRMKHGNLSDLRNAEIDGWIFEAAAGHAWGKPRGVPEKNPHSGDAAAWV